MFDIHCASLLIIGDRDDLPAITHQKAEAELAIPGLLSIKHSLCGSLRSSEADFIFSTNSQSVGSAAIARRQLTDENSSCLLLAVAHSDQEHYNQDTGTLFLDYLADIVTALVRRFSRVES